MDTCEPRAPVYPTHQAYCPSCLLAFAITVARALAVIAASGCAKSWILRCALVSTPVPQSVCCADVRNPVPDGQNSFACVYLCFTERLRRCFSKERRSGSVARARACGPTQDGRASRGQQHGAVLNVDRDVVHASAELASKPSGICSFDLAFCMNHLCKRTRVGEPLDGMHHVEGLCSAPLTWKMQRK